MPESIVLNHPSYSICFTEKGIQVDPASGAPDWAWQNSTPIQAKPTYIDDRVLYDYGDWTEQYLIKESSIEQQFILNKPMPVKDNVVRISGLILSKGEFSKTATGWRWYNEIGEVTLGNVFAFDANQRTIPAVMKVNGGQSVIEIQGADLEGVLYPVTIDPEIGTNDFRISTTGPDGDGTNYNASSAAVAHCVTNDPITYPGGIYMVVWSASNSGKAEIYAQRINGATGAFIGSEIRISYMGVPNTDVNYDASSPAITASATEFFIVWHGDDNSGTLVDNENEIYGQRLDPINGTLSGTRIRISTTNSDGNANFDATAPAIAYSATTNRYLVTWYSDHVSDNQFEIFSQGVLTDGTLIGSNVRISNMGTDPNTLYDAFNPDIAWNSTNNQFMIAWTGDIDAIGDGQNEVFVRRVEGATTNYGNTIASTVLISDMGPAASTAYSASDAAIAYNVTNNNYLVVWSGDDNTAPLVDDEFEIFGQFVGNFGAVANVNGFFRISTMGTNGSASFGASVPSIDFDPNLNQFLVTWHGDDSNGGLINDEIEIFGQLIRNTGVLEGSRIRISDAGGTGNSTYNATFPSVSYNNAYRDYLIVWQGDDNSTTTIDNEFEIWGQRFAELSTEPTAQPTLPGTPYTNITSSSLTADFVAATGSPDGYIVLRKSGSSPTDVPADHQVYAVNDVIGTSTVVHVGSAVTFNQTGLSANTTYHYDYFSYNGVNSSTNYRTTTPLEGSATTLFAEPGTQGTFSVTGFSTNSITINLAAGNGSNRLLVAKAGSAVDVFPTDGFSYTVNNTFGSGSNLGSSNFVVGSGTGAVTVTSLTPATVYHFRVFEFNGTTSLTNYNTSVITNSTGSRSTLSLEPTAQPTAPVNFSSITNSSYSVGFTAAAPVPTGYIAIRKSGSAPAQPADLPVDGTSYAVNDNIGGSVVASIGSSNPFSQSGLGANTEYYYLILSYNGSGANINYLTTTPLSGNQFTLANEPTTQATTVSFSSLATTSMTVGWTNGNGSERLVVVREASAVSFTPSDGTAYTGNSNFTAATDQGSGNKVVYRGNGNSVSLTNLTAGAVYHVRVYELNGSGQSANYFTSTATGNPASRTTLVNEPSGQASGISFSSITINSVQVNFTNGNGSSRLLVARQGSAVDTNPADGTSYTANSAYGTPASELGTGNYVVGAGSGPITVTGLSSNTTYHFRVYEFNGSSGSQNYNVNTASGNPNNTTTLVGEPTTQASGISFSSLGDNSYTVSWTNGNGNERLVVARQGSAVNVDPVDGSSYTGNANFSSATDLGSGNKVVFRGTGNSVNVTNLTPNTVYHFRVYELSGSGVLSNYLLTTATNNPNNRTTLQTQPAGQPGSLTFSQHTTTGVRLNFTAASGPPTGYLIIRKEASASSGIPQNGTTYSVSASLDGTIVAIGNSTQFDDTGLTAGTTYHYTIFSYNGSGQAINYLTASPLTGPTITIPDAPTAQPVTDPEQLTFIATWTSVTGATNYRLDVSTDNFATFVSGYNSKSVAQLFETVTGLSAGVTYQYRVRAENANGLQSVSSNMVSVTTDPPSGADISLGTVSAPDLATGESSITVSAQVNNGNGTKTVELFYRQITSTGAYTLVTMNLEGTYKGDIPASAFDNDLGVEYYVHAQDLSGTDQSDLMYAYKSFTTSSQPIPSIVRFGGTQKTYQMISIPFQLEDEDIQSVFGEALGDYVKTRWRLVQWQNSTEKYVDPPFFNNEMKLGKSYWFNSTEEVSVKIPAGSTRTNPIHNQSSPFKMQLLAGWNQVANPYPFSINWADVLAANPTVTDVTKYKIFNANELSFADNDDLLPYEGGFVFSQSAVTLNIPVTLKNSFSSGGRKAKDVLSKNIDGEEWLLPITLVQGDIKNSQGGIGMHQQASTSKDKWDDVTMPRFIEYLETNFYHPEFFWPKFSRDVVPTTEEHEWSLSIESNGEGNIELQWDAQAIAGAQANLFLYDEAEGRLVDMKVQSWFTIPQGSRKDLKLIYTQKDEYIPNNTMLGKAWPNPASTEVNIPIVLSGKGGAYNVEVDVYDLKGVKQKSIGVGKYSAGVHTAQWDIKDVNGNAVTSGVYIVKLKVNGRYLPEFSKVIVNRNR
ncbi:MAG: fibronectin type III domain-containing protein [Cyclobacteriaceae bacterium]